MKNYYDCLQVFAAIDRAEQPDEQAKNIAELALVKAFNALEPWQQDMLNLTMCTDLIDVL